VRCADTYYAGHPHPGAERTPRLVWTASTPFKPDAPTKGKPLLVVGNHGRWVVECDHCTGAQLASKSDLRFMCTSCGNAYQNGAWRPIKWPKNHEEIERLLDSREPLEANYEPGETVRDIEEQNALLFQNALLRAGLITQHINSDPEELV
jgi:hypothetical protein